MHRSTTLCWSANEGLLPTIGTAGTTILSDELNHASIIDGCRLAAGKRLRYKHDDMGDLERQLAAERALGDHSVFIVTDGVFSMEGSLADLPAIVGLAKRYDAVSVVDDSHGTGVMGKTGRGTIEHFGLEGQIDIITGTLGKALGGAAGGLSRERTRSSIRSCNARARSCSQTRSRLPWHAARWLQSSISMRTLSS